MNYNSKISVTNKLLKDFAEMNMKVDAISCKCFFYQPKVPQKILDRYKK